MSCEPIPCPSWETVTVEITAVCDCHETWGSWGNPWGSVDCPVHGAQVAANITELWT